MIDTTTRNGRIIAASLKLASERPWKDVALIDIAEAAGETLASVRDSFDGKTAIISGFVRAVDDALLKTPRRSQPGDAPRDALFEVIMARFDLLAPYKAALRSITKDAAPDLHALKAGLDSQHWMLAAAGINATGPQGAVRTLGLATVYISVFRTWLDDDDPGMARTMAALDRRLRRGERNLEAVEGAVGAVTGAARRFSEIFSGLQKRRSGQTTRPDARDEPRPQDNIV
jgi:ubiquinone biosynthesis protein COQ9